MNFTFVSLKNKNKKPKPPTRPLQSHPILPQLDIIFSLLKQKLDIYIHFVHFDNDFSQLRGINNLANKNGGRKGCSKRLHMYIWVFIGLWFYWLQLL